MVTGCAAPGSRVFLKRGTELTQPILSPIAPGQPVTVLVSQPWVPAGLQQPGVHHALGAGGSRLRPGTAASCSLPGSEQFRISSMLAVPAAVPAGLAVSRPSTAGAASPPHHPTAAKRVQAGAMMPTPPASPRHTQLQQQQVSRRSLAGQRRSLAAGVRAHVAKTAEGGNKGGLATCVGEAGESGGKGPVGSTGSRLSDWKR